MKATRSLTSGDGGAASDFVPAATNFHCDYVLRFAASVEIGPTTATDWVANRWGKKTPPTDQATSEGSKNGQEGKPATQSAVVVDGG